MNRTEEAVQELNAHALQLVRQNPRLDSETLFDALDRLFPANVYPDLTQEHIEAAVKAAL